MVGTASTDPEENRVSDFLDAGAYSATAGLRCSPVMEAIGSS